MAVVECACGITCGRQESDHDIPERTEILPVHLHHREARQAKTGHNGLEHGVAGFDDEISEILKKAGRPPIGSCYKSDYGYSLTWDVTVSGATAINFYPAEYMFSFWYRRDAEGKSDLAEWFLTSMLGWLQR